MSIKKSLNNKSVGGVSNTPLTDTLISSVTLPNRVLIDWLSATIDVIPIQEVSPNNYAIDLQNKEFLKLLSLLGFTGPISTLQSCKAHNGFTNAYKIGEHIELNYGFHKTKNSTAENPRYSLQVLLNGSACREFENFMNGSWHELLLFLNSHKANFKRLDWALDDFNGNIITPYDIEPYYSKAYYVSPLRNGSLIHNQTKSNGYIVTSGFSITLGSSGSNQFQIYDKLLERRAKDQKDLDTSVWYRYELRLVDDKANESVRLFLSSVQENDSKSFMEFVSSMMLAFLDIKTPGTDTNRSRWKTLPKWKKFLNEVKKIDLKTKHKINTTIERKIDWKKSSVFGVDFNIRMATHGLSVKDKHHFYRNQLENDLKAIENLDETKLSEINNYRKLKDLEPYTMEYLKHYIYNELLKELEDLETYGS